LYPPAKPSHEPEKTLWLDNDNSDEENSQPIFEIDHIVQFKELTEEDQSLIHSFMVNSDF
jgi:hypothetical protein